jgi:C4-type Zn-finger protein
MENHIEEIECPNCGERQIATVMHTTPFFTYIHDCVICKYTIMESEWVLIHTEEEIKTKLLSEEADN